MGEILNGHLYDWALVHQFFLKDFIEKDLNDRQISLRSPFDSPHLPLKVLIIHYNLVFLEIFNTQTHRKALSHLLSNIWWFMGWNGEFSTLICNMYLFFTRIIHLSIINEHQWALPKKVGQQRMLEREIEWATSGE